MWLDRFVSGRESSFGIVLPSTVRSFSTVPMMKSLTNGFSPGKKNSLALVKSSLFLFVKRSHIWVSICILIVAFSSPVRNFPFFSNSLNTRFSRSGMVSPSSHSTPLRPYSSERWRESSSRIILISSFTCSGSDTSSGDTSFSADFCLNQSSHLVNTSR